MGKTIVIMGASPGMGFTLAKLLVREGAKVVIGSKNGEELGRCADEITSGGGEVKAIMTDSVRPQDLSRLAHQTQSTFGKIDFWVNEGGRSWQSSLLTGKLDEERRLFESDFWSVRGASGYAIEVMREEGGVLINVAAEVSAAARPFFGAYLASKGAMRIFTDALRSELKEGKIPVKVCLVHPQSSGDGGRATAEAIVQCMKRPRRDLYVGGPARLTAIIDTFFPSVKDMVTESRMKDSKRTKDASGHLTTNH